jgi:hypothetical protein
MIDYNEEDAEKANKEDGELDDIVIFRDSFCSHENN